MWSVRGQSQAVRRLEVSFKTDRLAHAYLLAGPPHVGKMTFAIDIARMVNCLEQKEAPCGECIQCKRVASGYHADVHILALGRGLDKSSRRKDISIDQVREVQRHAILKPYEGAVRVIIVDGTEYLSEEASNSLLKLLEEPPPQVLLLLLVSWEDALLPTVRSRCHRIELNPLSRLEMVEELVERDVDSDHAETLARLSNGCLGWALTTLIDPTILDQREGEVGRIERMSSAGLVERFDYAASLASMFYRDRDNLLEVLGLWLRWWRDLLLLQEDGEKFVCNINRLDKLKEITLRFSMKEVVKFLHEIRGTLAALDQNANPRLAMEVMMLNLPKERL